MSDDGRVCPICRMPMTQEMKDKLTRAQLDEFLITGMCGNCQSNIYGSAPGEREAGRGGNITGSNNWNRQK